MEDNQTSTETVEATEKTPKAPVTLKASALAADLKAGISRKEQAKKYGVPLAAINRAYKKTASLKGKRVFSERGSRAVDIDLVDDIEVEAKDANTSAEASTESVSTENVSTENTTVNEQPAPETVAQIEQPEVASTPSW